MSTLFTGAGSMNYGMGGYNPAGFPESPDFSYWGGQPTGSNPGGVIDTGMSSIDWTSASGAIGNVFSAAGGGAQNTGGMFTQIGALGGPVGMGVGAVLDIVGSGIMHKKAKKAAHKSAREFWKRAETELAQMKKQQASDRSSLLAAQGNTGVRLESGTTADYRQTQQREQDIAYQRSYDELQAQYKQIRRSAGSGGLF